MGSIPARFTPREELGEKGVVDEVQSNANAYDTVNSYKALTSELLSKMPGTTPIMFKSWVLKTTENMYRKPYKMTLTYEPAYIDNIYLHAILRQKYAEMCFFIILVPENALNSPRGDETTKEYAPVSKYQRWNCIVREQEISVHILVHLTCIYFICFASNCPQLNKFSQFKHWSFELTCLCSSNLYLYSNECGNQSPRDPAHYFFPFWNYHKDVDEYMIKISGKNDQHKYVFTVSDPTSLAKIKERRGGGTLMLKNWFLCHKETMIFFFFFFFFFFWGGELKCWNIVGGGGRGGDG